MKFHIRLVFVLIGALGFISAAYSAEVKTAIKYIGANAIYVDAGRMQGIAVGNRADVRRDDKLLAILEVQFVADNSASCRLLESVGTIRVGDEVSVHAADAPPPAETPEPLPTSSGNQPEGTISRTKKAAPANRVSGHAGVGCLWQNDREAGQFDVAEPALSLRLRVENLLATRHTLSVRLRGRQSIRERDARGDVRRWTGRVYEVSLSYDNPNSPYRYALGRVQSNRLRGIGYVDGALVDYRASRRFTVGAFGGTEPDPLTTEIRARETKLGVFGSFEAGQVGAKRFQSTLAMAGRYVDGRISREFLYEQADLSLNSRLWLLQSAEFNLHRGWLKDMNETDFELVSFLMSARWNPRRDVTTNISYDHKTNYRTWETHSTPDSLFDDSRRNGWRAGADYRIVKQIQAHAGVGFRSGGAQAHNTRTASASVVIRDLLWRNLTVGTSLRTFSNAFTRGMQPSLTVSKDIAANLYVGAQAGRSSYDYRMDGRKVTNDWLRLQSEIYLARLIYTSAYVEFYVGDESSLDRLFVESGVRF